MNPTQNSHVTRLMEDNFPPKSRATFYVLPLFISWLPGILFESSAEATTSAKKGFFLSSLYILVNGILFFLQTTLQYFTKPSNHIDDYLFFGLALIAGMAYIFISLYSAWLSWQEAPGIGWLAKWAHKLENFLKR